MLQYVTCNIKPVRIAITAGVYRVSTRFYRLLQNSFQTDESAFVKIIKKKDSNVYILGETSMAINVGLYQHDLRLTFCRKGMVLKVNPSWRLLSLAKLLKTLTTQYVLLVQY